MTGRGPTTPTSATPLAHLLRADGRFPGLDIARGLAVLGMFVAHTLPHTGDTYSTLLTALAGGERPRTLFAVVGGISLALFVKGLASRPDYDSRRIRQTVAVRGIALVALGLYLQTMFSGVSIVLDTWGLLFLVFLPLLRVPSRWLTVGAIVLLPVGVALQLSGPSWDARFRSQGSLFAQPVDWFVDGSYPLLIWTALLAVGFVLARLDIGARRTQLWMLGGGLVVAVGAELAQKVLPEPDTFGGELALHIGAVGLAAAVVGTLCLVTTSSVVAIILYPLRAVGMMPLTIYTGHVLALSFRYWLDPSQPVKNATVWLVLTLAGLVFATLWRLLLGQGPLERLLRAIDGSARRGTRTPPGRRALVSPSRPPS